MSAPAAGGTALPSTDRPYLLETVDDAAVVQLYADGLDELAARERVLAWHLSEAVLWGRDIYYDQRYRDGLVMRETLEQVLRHASGIPPEVVAQVTRYAKLFWLNSGPFNNLTARKFVLLLPPSAWREAVRQAAAAGARFPVGPGESLDQLLDRLEPAFLDPDFDPIVTNKNPGPGRDILAASANNFYEGVTQADVQRLDERYPLTSRLVKRDGRVIEEVYRLSGRYGAYIAHIVAHLEAARDHATVPMQRAIDALIQWYRTGEESDRRAYDIAWVADDASPVDTINGFVEVYMDPRGHKGAWEGLVYYVNRQKTAMVQRIAEHAQWFEDRMPWDPAYRRRDVKGVTARSIDVVVEAGDSGPITPIGINLPNDEPIRETHGSKSVSLSNVLEAYDRSLPPDYHREFSWSDEEAERAIRWSSVANELATNLHEVIGHGSGLVEDRLGGAPQAFLREYYSAIEETRADLVALYFISDRKMVELGLLPGDAFDTIVTAEYESYARNALVQLRRVRTGARIEEDHMRNRQAIVHWLMANTDAVSRRARGGKSYYVLDGVAAMREGVARLLGEVQRIKSQGDYEAARALFEAYGIGFDPALRDEVVERVALVGLPSYTGFVMPSLEPVTDATGQVIDARISYPCDLAAQMLHYSDRYCLRPVPTVGPAAPVHAHD